MNVKEYIAQVYNYGYWANRRYLDVAEGLTDEQLHREQGHSWGSVHSVLVHMMSSETVWLRRWHGDSPKAHLDPKDFPSVMILRDPWTAVENQIREFIRLQTEDSLASPMSYSNFSGETFRVPSGRC